MLAGLIAVQGDAVGAGVQHAVIHLADVARGGGQRQLHVAAVQRHHHRQLGDGIVQHLAGLVDGDVHHRPGQQLRAGLDALGDDGARHGVHGLRLGDRAQLQVLRLDQLPGVVQRKADQRRHQYPLSADGEGHRLVLGLASRLGGHADHRAHRRFRLDVVHVHRLHALGAQRVGGVLQPLAHEVLQVIPLGAPADGQHHGHALLHPRARPAGLADDDALLVFLAVAVADIRSPAQLLQHVLGQQLLLPHQVGHHVGVGRVGEIPRARGRDQHQAEAQAKQHRAAQLPALLFALAAALVLLLLQGVRVLGIGHESALGAGDGLPEVGGHLGGGLVALGGVLAQGPHDHLVQGL